MGVGGVEICIKHNETIDTTKDEYIGPMATHRGGSHVYDVLQYPVAEVKVIHVPAIPIYTLLIYTLMVLCILPHNQWCIFN